MVGERPLLDAAPSRVVPFDVIEDLVGVEVAVVIGEHHRLRIPVELARHERADDQVLRLKRLVNRGRHVKTSGPGFEVVDVERHWVDGAVPTDDVPRMVIEHVAAYMVGPLQPHLDSTLAGFELGGRMEVALTERSNLRELAIARTVPVRYVDESRHLEAQKTRRGRLIEVDAVDGAARDDDVVVLVEGHAAELAAQHALAG